jgi:hypothetical protein
LQHYNDWHLLQHLADKHCVQLGRLLSTEPFYVNKYTYQSYHAKNCGATWVLKFFGKYAKAVNGLESHS